MTGVQTCALPISSGRQVHEPVDRFVEAGNLKSPLRVIFFTGLIHSLKTLHIPASRDHFGLDFGLIEGLGVDLGMLLRLGFQFET